MPRPDPPPPEPPPRPRRAPPSPSRPADGVPYARTRRRSTGGSRCPGRTGASSASAPRPVKRTGGRSPAPGRPATARRAVGSLGQRPGPRGQRRRRAGRAARVRPGGSARGSSSDVGQARGRRRPGTPRPARALRRVQTARTALSHGRRTGAASRPAAVLRGRRPRLPRPRPTDTAPRSRSPRGSATAHRPPARREPAPYGREASPVRGPPPPCRRAPRVGSLPVRSGGRKPHPPSSELDLRMA